MNAKTCKMLRKIAMGSSLPGEPLRQLVQYRQQCTPVYNPKTERRETRTAICAVNNPDTFRGRYRNLKSGRSIDRKRIVTRTYGGDKKVNYTSTIQKDISTGNRPVVVTRESSFLRKIAARITRFFRRKPQ